MFNSPSLWRWRCSILLLCGGGDVRFSFFVEVEIFDSPSLWKWRCSILLCGDEDVQFSFFVEVEMFNSCTVPSKYSFSSLLFVYTKSATVLMTLKAAVEK